MAVTSRYPEETGNPSKVAKSRVTSTSAMPRSTLMIARGMRALALKRIPMIGRMPGEFLSPLTWMARFNQFEIEFRVWLFGQLLQLIQ